MKISGKFGAFIGCSNYPECRYTRQFSDAGGEGDAAAMDGKVLGQDPETGLDVIVKSGRFGPYLQLGEPASKDEKPKRSGIPKGVDLASVDLELALKLLSLPREVGTHPDSGNTITAALGQYGPYVKHDRTYANLTNWEDLFTIGINHAVSLIADKVAGKGSRFGRGAQKTVLKDLGEHPEGGKIEILSGKYGPYISHNKINANVPKGKEPTEVTVEEAIRLLAERAEKAGTGKGKAKRAPAKKAATKKAAEKAPAKQPAKKGTKAAKGKETESAES
jgi:DNA topoisomerase-1